MKATSRWLGSITFNAMSGFDSSKKYVEYCSRVNQYLEEYFNIWSESRTTTSDMISIDDDGLVSVEGNVGLKPKFDKITLPVITPRLRA